MFSPSTLVKHTVADVRTSAELAAYGKAMPTVSVTVKRLLEREGLQSFARLLPALADKSGVTFISLHEVAYMGGGCLVGDRYVNAEKLLHELCGGYKPDRRAAAATAGEDAALLDNPIKWRQQIIIFHKAVVAIVDDENKLVAREGHDLSARLDEFERRHSYRLHAHEHCSGLYAKNLDGMGYSYVLDNKTDWRRARPADGRCGTGDKADSLPEMAELTGGSHVRDALMRKFTTLLVLFGEADLASAGFTTDGFGAVPALGGGLVVRWITLADIREFGEASKDMNKLAQSDAADIADWLEGELSRLVQRPRLKSLAAALMASLPSLQTRLTNRVLLAATQSAARRAERALLAVEARGGGGGEPPAKKLKAHERELALTGGLLEAEVTDKLPRLKGGNRAGPPCTAFAKGRCSGKCRFSHGDGGVLALREAAEADAAAIEEE